MHVHARLQEVMQSERMERKNSARRDQPIAENQRLFALMAAGDPSECARTCRSNHKTKRFRNTE